MSIKYIDQLDLKGKRVLIRVDYNVPYGKDMNITDDSRITATKPTIDYCLEKDASVILISHMGRPKGKRVPSMSLKPVADRLSEIVGKEILFIEEPIGNDVKEIVNKMKSGDIALLENIRFYPGEEKNYDDFAMVLGELGDIYINDAFATAHRAHASNVAITKYVKECAAGFLLKNEIMYLNKALNDPEKPLAVIIGGAKVSTKIDAIRNILNRVDSLLIGGGMGFTFLKAIGYSVGKSILENDLVDTAKEIIDVAKERNLELLLPVDIVIALAFENDSPKKVVSIDQIPADMMGMDIGPETINSFIKSIKRAKTVIWNGPMGVFEMPSFANGTNEIARAIAMTECMSIVGGGESVMAVKEAGVADRITYISTGGGAFLEMLEGKTLPAIAALE